MNYKHMCRRLHIKITIVNTRYLCSKDEIGQENMHIEFESKSKRNKLFIKFNIINPQNKVGYKEVENYLGHPFTNNVTMCFNR